MQNVQGIMRGSLGFVLCFALACSAESPEGDPGLGGSGATAGGGTSGAGVIPAGGSATLGGAAGTAGTLSAAGSPTGASGAPASAGAPSAGSGGTALSGGASNAGGASNVGGASNLGGASNVGGVTNAGRSGSGSGGALGGTSGRAGAPGQRAGAGGSAAGASASAGLGGTAASGAGGAGQCAGRITYSLARAAAPTAQQSMAYERITLAMDRAVMVYNCNTSLQKTLNVSYNPDVATADGNPNGSLRFGSMDSMNHITAMHEISHALGIGGNEMDRMVMNGIFPGPLATAELRAITGNPADEVHADNQHFWPYGLNYPSEVKSDADLLHHCRMVVAILKDLGL